MEIAALTGNVDVMKALLKKAPPSPSPKKGMKNIPLLSIAVIGGHDAMIKYLVEDCRVNVNIVDDEGTSAT